jgi:hypothetical protein
MHKKYSMSAFLNIHDQPKKIKLLKITKKYNCTIEQGFEMVECEF